MPGIQGGSVDAFHVNWIDIASVSQTWTSSRRHAACEITIGKQLDVAGPRLWLAAVTGQAFGEIRLEAVKGAERPMRFYEVRLQNVRISSISTTAAPGGEFIESVSLSASSLVLAYYPQNPDGSLANPVMTNINCN